MNKHMKKEKGITLVSLVITVTTLIILSTFVTYSGIDFLRTAKLKKFASELTIVQLKVNQIYDDLDKINIEEIGTSKLPENSKIAFDVVQIPVEERREYRYLTSSDLKQLQIDGIDKGYLIDFKNRRVIDLEGTTYEGKKYYTLEQIPNGLYNVEYKSSIPTFDCSYNWVEKNIWEINISNIKCDSNIKKWKVKYQYEDELEEITESFNIKVNRPGKYKVILFSDNIKSEPVNLEILDLKVGDYVSYKPKNTGKEFKYRIRDIDANQGIQVVDKTIKEETLLWRIYSINNDGSIELLANSTNELITLYGYNGYNDGVDIINDACKTLYSDERHHIAARSIKIEDLENKLTEQGKIAKGQYTSNSGAKVGQLINYTGNQQIPQLYSKEQGYNNQTSGLKVSDSAKGLEIFGKQELTNGLSIRQTYWHVNISKENYGDVAEILKPTSKVNSHYQLYWGASRYADVETVMSDVNNKIESAGFGIQLLGTSDVTQLFPGFNSLFYSFGGMTKGIKDQDITGSPIRPMVTLNADQIDLKLENNNTETNRHEIIWNDEV